MFFLFGREKRRGKEREREKVEVFVFLSFLERKNPTKKNHETAHRLIGGDHRKRREDRGEAQERDHPRGVAFLSKVFLGARERRERRERDKKM